MSVMEAKLAQQPRYFPPTSLSRCQDQFETMSTGCRFLMQDAAGNVVKCFVSREFIFQFEDMPLSREHSIAELERLFESSRLGIELLAGAMFDRGIREAEEDGVVINLNLAFLQRRN
jgi:hypothetical protein